MATVTLYTGKQFKVDSDGFCKVFAAHIYKGSTYNVEEFSSRSSLEVFVNHLKRHSFGDVHCSAECCRSIDGGKNWHSFKYNSISF